MTTLETFDYGAPKNPGGCHIGLYQPILNRFLLTINHICSLIVMFVNH